jgi:3-hydroxybutyryl-CoA dehydrogenase
LSETVAIIGAGPLGRWLALQAARSGFRVLLEDVMPHNLHHAQEWLRQELSPAFLTPELGPESAGNEHGAGVGFVSTIEDAVREADLAIDCVPDELESKLEIFCLLDRMAPPRTVLATPTTRLSIADLASCTYRPDRCVAIAQEASSLTEGVSSEIQLRTTSQTSAETVALLTRFWSRLGFTATFAPDPTEAAGIHR